MAAGYQSFSLQLYPSYYYDHYTATPAGTARPLWIPWAAFPAQSHLLWRDSHCPYPLPSRKIKPVASHFTPIILDGQHDGRMDGGWWDL